MRKRRQKNEINVVPYIDVMLVLLVIFMVSSPMMQSGNIDVPTAGPLAAPPVEAAIIEVDKDGKLALKRTVNDKATPLSNLEFQRELAKLVKTDHPILIAAHNDLPYQRVIDVLEAARSEGAKKVSLQTRSGNTGK
ncbi:MAG: ExbD/TolR family protein [Betaproteobacteria bacterium]|nr:ExbD/TolR family protein [Betaproteobacteria bacterium]MCL2162668.1 ExbD/TolR family protein [Betaproteobacteria bacterium]